MFYRSLKMYFYHNISEQKKRIERILPNFLKQTKFFFEFSDYFDTYRAKSKIYIGQILK